MYISYKTIVHKDLYIKTTKINKMAPLQGSKKDRFEFVKS